MTKAEHRGPILISEICLRNVLSFGPDTKPIPLGSLNVLIGANGSGKSNLIEAIGLMRESIRDIRKIIAKRGGMHELIWKGSEIGERLPTTQDRPTALVQICFTRKSKDLFHRLEFKSNRLQQFEVEFESIGSKRQISKARFFQLDNNKVQVVVNDSPFLKKKDVQNNQSVLSQIKNPQAYPDLSFLEKSYDSIRVFAEFQFGRNSITRQPQNKFESDQYLEENFSNLTLFLQRILANPEVKHQFIDCLQDLYVGLTDIQFEEIGDFVQMCLLEGNFKFPATRLSDGTMHYLCLLAILLDPTPPPFICLEEPELGMHPDIIVRIAQLLREASKRTQIIVTTHSDIILDALSAYPETILVAEKHDGKTEITPLDPEEIQSFLEHRSLGDIWNSNIIGGRRW